jgi:hypothetical protein
MRYYVFNVYDGEMSDEFDTLEDAQESADRDNACGCEEDQPVLVVDDLDIIVEVYFHNGDEWALAGPRDYELVGLNIDDVR